MVVIAKYLCEMQKWLISKKIQSDYYDYALRYFKDCFEEICNQ